MFTSRPASTVSDDLLYGSSDIAFSPYGEHWRQIRKLVTTHLFNVKKVHSYCRARKEEVSDYYMYMQHIHKQIVHACILFVYISIGEPGDGQDRGGSDHGCGSGHEHDDEHVRQRYLSRAMSGKFFRAEGRNKLFQELVEANSTLFGQARSLGFLSGRFLHNRHYTTTLSLALDDLTLKAATTTSCLMLKTYSARLLQTL
jgi:hypothetical protein